MTQVWQIKPNWRESYEVTYAHRTDVMRSEAGREQRRRLRQSPRKTIKFQITRSAYWFRILYRTLISQHGAIIWAPELTKKARLSVASATGANTVTVESVPSWLADAGQVLLVSDTVTELRTITGVVGNVVTFQEANTSDWAAGTWLCWALQGRIDASVQGQEPVTGVMDVQIVLHVEPGFEDAPSPPAAPTVWNGREVFLLKANWQPGRDIAFARDVEQVDYGFGPVATFLPIAYDDLTRTATFTAMSVDEAQQLIDFFDRVAGSVGEFYAPADTPDIILSQPALSGANFLWVAGTDFADAFGADAVHKAICGVMTDGRRWYAGISSIVASGGNSQITLADALPYDVSPDTIRTLCWMPVCRLASDEMTIEWLTDEVCQTKLGFLSLEALPAETAS